MTVAAGRALRKRNTQGSPQAAVLLAWYDRHRRKLPWRAEPGETADPYRVWLSEIMLRQTTVKAVAPCCFLARFDNVGRLAAAPHGCSQAVGRPRLLCTRAQSARLRAAVRAAWRTLPGKRSRVAKLPGIGPYTAAAIAAISSGCRRRPSTATSNGWWRGCLRSRRRGQSQSCGGSHDDPARAGRRFAQALVDLGATICTPRPACALCPWNAASRHGRAAIEDFHKAKPRTACAAVRPSR
jgi:A/G-specific adenine glycosylase